ncbi:tyrosine-type recombinase/integrase [Pseudomonas putida]|uniref:tyrosine-type recombinase/integrase n=1 Tax=Pseudomonas putida TaxID=303 RepID=UPI0009B7460B|nr:site-specific integrase [Pseudomonas putida]
MNRYFLNRVGGISSGCALVPDHLFIYERCTQAIVVEVAEFLHDEYSLRLRSRFTQNNVVNSIWQWLEFVSACSQEWKEADKYLLLDFRDVMLRSVSPRTGRKYCSGTVSNIMSAVLTLYSYLKGRCLVISDIPEIRSCRSDWEPYDHQPLFGLRGDLGSNGKRRSGYFPKGEGSSRIRPFLQKDLQAFLSVMGPRASEKSSSDSRCCRNRLIADFGWAVGLRNSEIANLKAASFENLKVDFASPAAQQRLDVTGKGNIARIVAVPNWLVLDAQIYSGQEREQSIRMGRSKVDSGHLIVSNKEARSPGKKISTRRILQIVENGCVKAGLIETVERLVEGKSVNSKKAMHCVHDLRHTYAVLTYHAEVMNGNVEPWKKIQAQLGHKSLQTTIDTYLRYVSVFG